MYKKINILLSSFMAPIPLLCLVAVSEILQVPKEIPDLSEESLNQLYTVIPFLLPLYAAYLIFLSPIVYFMCIGLMKINMLKFSYLVFLNIVTLSLMLGVYLLSIKDLSTFLNELIPSILFIYGINFTFLISLFMFLKIINKISPHLED